MRRPLRTLMTLAAVASLTAVASRAADDAASGFKPLFNGRDLTGWRIYLRDNADNNQTKTFTIENGEIHCTGQPPGYLITEKEYGDYVLRVQWRFPGRPPAYRKSSLM